MQLSSSTVPSVCCCMHGEALMGCQELQHATCTQARRVPVHSAQHTGTHTHACCSWQQRREALGLPPGTTDPLLDGLDDSEWQFEEEPEELCAARERLAAYIASAAARAGQEEEEALPGGWCAWDCMARERGRAGRPTAWSFVQHGRAGSRADALCTRRMHPNPIPTLSACAELAEGSGAAPGGSATLFEAPGSQEDMQVVLEERAASLATLQQPDKEEALAVAVTASGCRSAPSKADEEATSSGEAAAAEEPRGHGWAAGVVVGLAEAALRPSSPSEVGSESVASDEEDNLEALD